MMQPDEDLPVLQIPYDGDGPALQGKAIDVRAVVQGAAVEGIRAGTMKPIVLFDTHKSETLPDLPTITSTNPEIENFSRRDRFLASSRRMERQMTWWRNCRSHTVRLSKHRVVDAGRRLYQALAQRFRHCAPLREFSWLPILGRQRYDLILT
jgi:hypothetical protein